jgi:hypothetical protein
MSEQWRCYQGNGGPCQRSPCANYMQLTKIYNSPNFLKSFPGQELGCPNPSKELLNFEQEAQLSVQNELSQRT